LLQSPTWNRKKRIKNEEESTGGARHLWTSASRAGHPGRTKTGGKVSAPKSTSRGRRMEIALSKVSVTVQLKKSTLFPSLTELMRNRLRQRVSRPFRNSWVGIGGASKCLTDPRSSAQSDSISAGLLLLSVRHRPRARCAGTAEQNARVAEGDACNDGEVLVPMPSCRPREIKYVTAERPRPGKQVTGRLAPPPSAATCPDCARRTAPE
jgi:hypothetical protein